eukprot:CAMPEP_0179000686 /NCGR_PEP_ID=MMETSP0795-20121207/10839_1 /TAXON_ID=88552 /ORGANISM="Amoebophrya sp., Strain Ameob2" /LENGTH=33 /DNA_ID= /DNA_START= /DNA_END= /DNA_ORIENTATION=
MRTHPPLGVGGSGAGGPDVEHVTDMYWHPLKDY